MVAQNAVLLGAEPLDAAPALVIEEMRAEFDRDAVELLEGMGQQQQFALGVERAALHALGIPGRADLDAAVGRIDIHVGRHARDLAVGIEHRERQHRARRLQARAGGRSPCPCPPAVGMEVYQSFHSSPSFTASTSPSRWSCDSGSSRACAPRSVTGSSQGISCTPLFRHCEERSDEAIQIRRRDGILDCFARSLLGMTESDRLTCSKNSAAIRGRGQSIATSSPLPDSVM